jgi:hypothetical protein
MTHGLLKSGTNRWLRPIHYLAHGAHTRHVGRGLGLPLVFLTTQYQLINAAVQSILETVDGKNRFAKDDNSNTFPLLKDMTDPSSNVSSNDIEVIEAPPKAPTKKQKTAAASVAPAALPKTPSSGKATTPRNARGRFSRRGSESGSDSDDVADNAAQDGLDSAIDMTADILGTEFDPFTSNRMIKSGLLEPSSSKRIRPVEDCLARARWECRYQSREELIKVCRWIRRFHHKSVTPAWSSNAQLRSLKERLKSDVKEASDAGVLTSGMPDPAEILAARLCAPKGESNAIIDTCLFELGLLHYGTAPMVNAAHTAASIAYPAAHSAGPPDDTTAADVEEIGRAMLQHHKEHSEQTGRVREDLRKTSVKLNTLFSSVSGIQTREQYNKVSEEGWRKDIERQLAEMRKSIADVAAAAATRTTVRTGGPAAAPMPAPPTLLTRPTITTATQATTAAMAPGRAGRPAHAQVTPVPAPPGSLVRPDGPSGTQPSPAKRTRADTTPAGREPKRVASGASANTTPTADANPPPRVSLLERLRREAEGKR